MDTTTKHTLRTRAGTVLAAIALAVVGLAVTPAPARAASPNCQHHAGDGVPVAAKHVTTFLQETTTVVGASQLCRDGAGRYWGYLVMYQPLPANRWANVWIRAYWGNQFRAEYSCDAPGGNDHILPRQTMCWTPKIYGTDPHWNYKIEGEVYCPNPCPRSTGSSTPSVPSGPGTGSGGPFGPPLAEWRIDVKVPWDSNMAVATNATITTG